MECSGTEDAFVLYDFHYFCSFNLDYKYKVICKNNFILASYGSDWSCIYFVESCLGTV